jgi:hypothetical protein
MAKVKVTYNGKTVTYGAEHTFLTQGKLMASDFIVTPEQDAAGDIEALRTVTPTESLQSIVPAEGKIGIGQVDVLAITPTYVGTGIQRKDAASVTDADWSGQASGDSVAVTVTIPAGYYENPTTVSYTVANVLPDVDPDAGNGNILIGYHAYDDQGNELVGTMPNNGASNLQINNEAGTVAIGEGYYNGQGIVTATPGSIKSGAATIADPVFSADHFEQAVSIDAPSVEATGYISGTVGTKAGNNVTAKSLDVIEIGAVIEDATLTVKPVIHKQAVSGAIDAAAGEAVSAVKAGKPFVAVDTAAISSSTNVSVGVTKAGYGNAEHFEGGAVQSIAAGAQAADMAYIPIKEGAYSAAGTASGVITLNAPSWNSTNENYDYSASDSITGTATATVGTAGWLEAGSATGNITGSASKAGVLNRLAVTVSAEDKALTPAISREAFTIANVSDAASGAAVTTAPTTGVYVKIKSAAGSAVAQASATAGEGYSDGQAGHYSVSGAQANFTMNASADTYVPITEVALATPALTGAANSNATAPALNIGTVAENAVWRITATETQAEGWTKGTETAHVDIPVFVGEFA